MAFIPLLPVIQGTFLGLDLISNMMGLCTHGIKKCVPSPTTWFLIPENLSNITALWPPSTKISILVRLLHPHIKVYHYKVLNLQHHQLMQPPIQVDRFY